MEDFNEKPVKTKTKKEADQSKTVRQKEEGALLTKGLSFPATLLLSRPGQDNISKEICYLCHLTDVRNSSPHG